MNKEIKIVPPEGYSIDKENSTFECIKFKPIKKGLPKTWEEFCKTHPIIKEEYYIGPASTIRSHCNDSRFSNDDRNLLPSKKLAEAILALCQLIQLRECYNDGWEPDWTNGDFCKYCIDFSCDKIHDNYCYSEQKVLAFRTRKLRDEFLNNFKDLIEIAKPLL